jgi:hypothetical protein
VTFVVAAPFSRNMTRRTSLRKQLIVFLAAQIATPGCLFVPKTVEHRELVRDERPERSETAGMIVFAGRSQGSQVQARAFVRQLCNDGGVHVFNRTTSKQLDLEMPHGGGGEGEAYAVVLFLPITFLSLIISGISVAASKDEHDVVRDHFWRTRDCSHPLSAARVVGLLPSGETTVALTDENGVAWFDVPSDEPAGNLIVSLADHQVAPLTIPYGQPAPIFACANGDCAAQWNAQPAPPMRK